MILAYLELTSIFNIAIFCRLHCEWAWQRIHERWGQGRLGGASDPAVRVTHYRTVNECCRGEVFLRCDTDHHHQYVKIYLEFSLLDAVFQSPSKITTWYISLGRSFYFQPYLTVALWLTGGDLGQLISLLAGQMQLSAGQQEQWESDGNGETITSCSLVISIILYLHILLDDYIWPSLLLNTVQIWEILVK